jgi:hypothetical protein
MKYLIFFLVIMSLSLFAQNKKNNDEKGLEIQTKDWMTKISSDPEMRLSMITMILDETKGNKEEMSNLGKTILDNPEMNTILADMMQRKTNTDNMSMPSRNMMGDSAKTMKMSGYQPLPYKK